jgi:hypothetical protein
MRARPVSRQLSRRWLRLAVPACAWLMLASPVSRAASQLQFDVWMRDIDRRSVSVQQHIAARRLDDAGVDARELERLYGLMEQYFVHDYPANDAAQMSQDGRLLAALIPGALDRQDFDAAAQAARTIALACNDCHDPYKPFK